MNSKIGNIEKRNAEVDKRLKANTNAMKHEFTGEQLRSIPSIILRPNGSSCDILIEEENYKVVVGTLKNKYAALLVEGQKAFVSKSGKSAKAFLHGESENEICVSGILETKSETERIATETAAVLENMAAKLRR